MGDFGTFSSAREAKEYLIQRIVLQAQRDGISLSEIESKMLYFSKSYWTLPEMPEISQEFDRDYNQGEFEVKIERLVHNIKKEFRSHLGSDHQWDEAVRAISQEDHYLLVLLNDNNVDGSKKTRPPGDYLKLFLTALLIVTAILAVVWLIKDHQ